MTNSSTESESEVSCGSMRDVNQPADADDSVAVTPNASMQCSVILFSSRETRAELLASVRHAARSAHQVGGEVDIIVNGNQALADAMVNSPALNDVAQTEQTPVRLWYLELGDKAHAWNEAIYRIAPCADAHVFVDGYVRLDQESVQSLCEALIEQRSALAASGIPRAGRSSAGLARTLREQGGLHGNLYALSGTAVLRLRHLGFKLPLGIYRNDGMLGAALAFGLDFHSRQWLPKERIALPKSAGWDITPLRWWNVFHVAVQLRRRLKQAQGEFETAAYRELFAVRQLAFGAVPATATALVNEWMARCPIDFRRLSRRSLWNRRAARQFASMRDWSLARREPILLFDSRRGADH